MNGLANRWYLGHNGFVGFILFFGLLFADSPQLSLVASHDALQDGALKGYQMMDLMAAFFFSSLSARFARLFSRLLAR